MVFYILADHTQEDIVSLIPGSSVTYYYIHSGNCTLCLEAGCGETRLRPDSGCVSRCRSIVVHLVALFSTLAYLPLLLLAQVDLRDILPEIWKTYNDSLVLRQKHLFSACGSL